MTTGRNPDRNSLGALGAFSPNPCLRFVKSDSAFPNGQNGRHFLEQWLHDLERSGPISIHHIFCPYFFLLLPGLRGGEKVGHQTGKVDRWPISANCQSRQSRVYAIRKRASLLRSIDIVNFHSEFNSSQKMAKRPSKME